MKRLQRGVPRGLTDHRTTEGKAYIAHIKAIMTRLPDLPESARPLLRTAGRLAIVEIPALERELDQAVARKRVSEARRLRRALATARFQHQRVEERLEIIAAAAEPDLAKALAGFARRANADGEMAE
jgi:primosomal protein N''